MRIPVAISLAALLTEKEEAIGPSIPITVFLTDAVDQRLAENERVKTIDRAYKRQLQHHAPQLYTEAILGDRDLR